MRRETAAAWPQGLLWCLHPPGLRNTKSFYQQAGSAPLIFIIPGLGSPAAMGSTAYLAEVLVDQGFHVLILPSPFNWNFALAASRSGLPGITQEDSEDLYSAMHLILQDIKFHYGARVGGIGLIGLSDGALYGRLYWQD